MKVSVLQHAQQSPLIRLTILTACFLVASSREVLTHFTRLETQEAPDSVLKPKTAQERSSLTFPVQQQHSPARAADTANGTASQIASSTPLQFT